VDENGSGSWPVPAFDIVGVECLGAAIRVS